jgi:hypothetical protein
LHAALEIKALDFKQLAKNLKHFLHKLLPDNQNKKQHAISDATRDVGCRIEISSRASFLVTYILMKS